MRSLLLALLLASPLAANDPVAAVTACFEYEFTQVGNPVSRRTTECLPLEITGENPRALLERRWAVILDAGSEAQGLWETLRSLGREKSYLTIALRSARLSLDSGGATLSATMPAMGPEALRYERVRVWLRDGSPGFDYFKRGGKGPERLFDIGRPIGAP
ncbi:MAG: hypothetical protein HYY25_14940 [Candidatus Wallbacteria bacterium]|nr:hypothetical protein [Candidatus Wallbacteria bacterium]